MHVAHQQRDNLEQEHRTRLVAALQNGLPLVPRPYAVLAQISGISEAEVMAQIREMLDDGTLKRLGVIVRHHELGYRANAMVVWDIPDHQTPAYGKRIAQHDFVTLCYHRARRLPMWPYNLYCMIHGRDRRAVVEKIDSLIDACGLHVFSHQILFSCRRFKQHGARYQDPVSALEALPTQGQAGGA